MAATTVVGFDGSDTSSRALDRAISDVKAAAGRLIVVVVAPLPVDPLAPSMVGPWVLGPQDQDELALARDVAEDKAPPALQPTVEQAAKRVAGAGLEPEIIWRMGDPAREILDAARANGASTIVLGEHHHRLLGALFGDDVDAAVQREANCSVVLVA